MKGGEVLLRVGDTRAVHPLASVTKLIASWAVLVAVRRALVRLDTPAGPEGATVAHLLAHASGLPMDSEKPQVAPGVRRIYSNAGYEVLGRVVEDAVGAPVTRWIEESVLEPLGMSSSSVEGSPAHSGRGSVEDLLALAAELARPQLVGPELAARALTPQFPELAGVVPGYGRHTPCPWGLGPEIRGGKSPHWTAPTASPHTFGHFGVSGSFLWVDPERDMAGVFLGSEPFGPWHKENWARLNEALVTWGASASV
ncbi:serine hydrolase [Schaalia sp. 19OD2882]|uniref:serine hydrolase domain-containing protein n=1 Tax=Schaalia sp. 19OD2882 TaxID=2794089 RepID=UPI0020A7C7AA|nr:serine hydrolase domain-containing protein [Schaalia sp. 19OD2882]